jgi:hypothetical protein
MNAQGGARHVVQVEIGLEHPQDPRLARRAGFGHDEIEHLDHGSLDEFDGGVPFGHRRLGRNGEARPDEGDSGCSSGQTQHISAVGEQWHVSLSLSLSLSLLPKLAELSRRQQLALKIAQVPLKGDFRVTIF